MGDNQVVSVIGDGAITAGMAYEAMNNAGFLDSRMIIVLNDNQQVSLPTQYNKKSQAPVGALSNAFVRLQSNRELRDLRETAKSITKAIGGDVHNLASRVDEYARGMISGEGATFFEEMGLYYIGTVDGHNMEELVTVLENVKAEDRRPGPVLVHVVTQKGRGYAPAENAEDKYHGVQKFDFETGVQKKPDPAKARPSYTSVFAKALDQEAARDDKICAVHAAMAGGTGLTAFE